MNKALTALTLVCGLALALPASAAPVKSMTAKPAAQGTMKHVKRSHHKKVAHKKVMHRRAHSKVRHSRVKHVAKRK